VLGRSGVRPRPSDCGEKKKTRQLLAIIRIARYCGHSALRPPSAVWPALSGLA